MVFLILIAQTFNINLSFIRFLVPYLVKAQSSLDLPYDYSRKHVYNTAWK